MASICDFNAPKVFRKIKFLAKILQSKIGNGDRGIGNGELGKGSAE